VEERRGRKVVVPVRYLYRKSLITCNGMSQNEKKKMSKQKKGALLYDFQFMPFSFLLRLF